MWEPIITFALIGICLIILLVRYDELPVYCKYIGIILLCHLIFYAFTAYLMMHKINNLILFHILKPLQYALTSFYLMEIINEPRTRRSILISVPMFIAISLYFSFTAQQITEYNSYSILIYNFLVTVWILLSFRQWLFDTEVIDLRTYPAFWISVGLLFYCVATTFSEGLMNYLIKYHPGYALSFYYVGIVLSFFLYAFIIVGFLCDKIFKNPLV